MSDVSKDFSPQQLSPDQRIVITGLGAVSPYGVGVEPLVAALRAGESAIRPIEDFDLGDCRCTVGARIPHVDYATFDSSSSFRRAPRASRFAIMATDEALRASTDGELPWNPERVGVCLGTYRGMSEVSEKIWTKMIEREPRFVPALLFQETVTNAVASAISIRWGLKGTNYAISAGNASGYQGLYLAAQTLRSGRCEAMIAGTFDLFTEANHHDMDDLGMLSDSNASRPFDRRRDGFVMGEGTVVAVLETLATARARGAQVLAEISGIGIGHDAYGFATTHPEGVGLAAAMEQAMERAGIEPEAIGFIAAAANSTQSFDRAEHAAIREVFGAAASTIPVSSPKALTGEAMAASDMFNLVACVAALSDAEPSVHNGSEDFDPDCDLAFNLPERSDREPLTAALANSYSYFGGSAAALVLQSCSIHDS